MGNNDIKIKLIKSDNQKIVINIEICSKVTKDS